MGAPWKKGPPAGSERQRPPLPELVPEAEMWADTWASHPPSPGQSLSGSEHNKNLEMNFAGPVPHATEQSRESTEGSGVQQTEPCRPQRSRSLQKIGRIRAQRKDKSSSHSQGELRLESGAPASSSLKMLTTFLVTDHGGDMMQATGPLPGKMRAGKYLAHNLKRFKDSLQPSLGPQAKVSSVALESVLPRDQSH